MSRLLIYAEHEPGRPRLDTWSGDEIGIELQRVGVRFERWSANAPVDASVSTDDILSTYAREIGRLKRESGYITCDVVSMSPDHPEREALRAKFLAEHVHLEDEVRFFVHGRGLFCLHIEDEVLLVLCEKDDLISVPARTRHWFDMGTAPNFTAIRLFNNPDGWIAHLTGAAIANDFPMLDELAATPADRTSRNTRI